MVYIHPLAFETLAATVDRDTHQRCLVVSALVVNNNKVSYLLQRAGLLTLQDAAGTALEDDCLGNEWREAAVALKTQESFIEAVGALGPATVQRWAEALRASLGLPRPAPYVFERGARVSINLIAVRGSDFSQPGGAPLVPLLADDERFLTVQLPVELGRDVCMAPEALAVHLSFEHQRAVMDQEVLPAYKAAWFQGLLRAVA